MRLIARTAEVLVRKLNYSSCSWRINRNTCKFCWRAITLGARCIITYITAYSLPFQSKFAKCIRGQIFLSTKPNLHWRFSSFRAILAGQRLKRALMALGMQPREKVYSCDVGMAGFHQHLLSSEMKVSSCTSIKWGSVHLTGSNRKIIFLLSTQRTIILLHPIFLTDRKKMEKEETSEIHSDIMLKGSLS